MREYVIIPNNTQSVFCFRKCYFFYPSNLSNNKLFFYDWTDAFAFYELWSFRPPFSEKAPTL